MRATGHGAGTQAFERVRNLTRDERFRQALQGSTQVRAWAALADYMPLWLLVASMCLIRRYDIRHATCESSQCPGQPRAN
jgi:hypothetical protein